MRRRFSLPLLLSTLLSSYVHALPAMLEPNEISNEQFELVSTVHIEGDIRDNIYQLIDINLANYHSDVYIIEDIREDTSDDTLSMIVNLYDLIDQQAYAAK